MVSDNSKVIKELLEIINSKVGKIEAKQGIQSFQTGSIKDQLSVLNEKLDGLESKVDIGFKGLEKKIDELDKKADSILEFADGVDEDLQDHKKRLKRLEAIAT